MGGKRVPSGLWIPRRGPRYVSGGCRASRSIRPPTYHVSVAGHRRLRIVDVTTKAYTLLRGSVAPAGGSDLFPAQPRRRFRSGLETTRYVSRRSTTTSTAGSSWAGQALFPSSSDPPRHSFPRAISTPFVPQAMLAETTQRRGRKRHGRRPAAQACWSRVAAPLGEKIDAAVWGDGGAGTGVDTVELLGGHARTCYWSRLPRARE